MTSFYQSPYQWKNKCEFKNKQTKQNEIKTKRKQIEIRLLLLEKPEFILLIQQMAASAGASPTSAFQSIEY